MTALAGFSTATFTPTAAAYSAGNVMEGAKLFVGAGAVTGGEIMITTVDLEVDASALQASEGDYLLELYTAQPPSAYANNAAWDLPVGDRALHVGTIDLGTPVDKGSTLKVSTTGINHQVSVPSGGALWGYLVTAAGFTATAVGRKVTLHTVPL